MSKKKNKGESQADKLYNLQAQQLAAQVANWAAQLDFQKERFRLLEMPEFQQGLQLEVDKFAWQKAEDTWKKAFQEATLTGMYNGQPTTQWLMDQARLTGSFNGERTLEGKLTDAQIQDMQDKMKLANDQFLAATTGFFNGQKTFDRQKFEAAQALEGWKFISSLSGPQNAFKQARAIGSMPGGQGGLMAAFAGEYMLPSSTAVGSGGAGGNDPAGQLADMMSGFRGGAPPPAAPAPGAPPATIGTPPQQAVQPTAPTTAPVTSFGAPGRGFPLTQWNDATRAAAVEWERNNPHLILDGSQLGYRARTANDPPAPGHTVGGQGMAEGQAFTQGVTYQPEGAQAPVNQYNYSGTGDGSVQVFPPGVASPPNTPDVSSISAMNPADMPGIVNPTYQYNPSQPNTVPAPYQYGQTPQPNASGIYAPTSASERQYLPNQLDARNMSNAYDYQKELLWADFEDKGWDKGLAQEAYLRSLPKYGGVSKGAIAF